MKTPLFIGMISGTSRDGVDAVLVSFAEDQPEIRASICTSYPPVLAKALDRMISLGERPGPAAMNELDVQLADHFSATVESLLEQVAVDPSEITAIGSHGQTVWHDPEGKCPESIQLGNPRWIAEKTGIVTVGDFRTADIKAGGQGAPLAPLLHRALFRRTDSKTRIVLNLGGIANISIIDGDGGVSGFDTGPANCLMDAWIGMHQGNSFDHNGDWAADGESIPALLDALLSDPYFQQPAPKSTGVEYFNLAWLERLSPENLHDARDVQATLAELTAVSVAKAIRPHSPADVLVCGGGVHNRHLIQRLQAQLSQIPVQSTQVSGLDPDWVEAVLFAWLARERLAERTLDTPGITGAMKPVMLGVIANPR